MRSPFAELEILPVNESMSVTNSGGLKHPFTDLVADEFPQEATDEDLTPSLLNNEFSVSAEKGISALLDVSAHTSLRLKTGIFIPTGFNASSEIDIVLYLHGLFARGNEPVGIDAYWKTYSNIRDYFYTCRRNAILIAPGLGKDPQKDEVILNQKGGLDKFLSACFKEIKTGGYLPASSAIGNIIIAAHSAGGKPLARIAADKGLLNDQIIECWGFDCLYAEWWATNISTWAKGEKKFYHYWAWSCSAKHLASCPKVVAEKIITNPNVKNIAPPGRTGHQQVIGTAWLYSILNRDWFAKTGAISQQEYKVENEELIKDLSAAVRLNRKYAASLGWDQYVLQINDLLLPYSGMSNVSLGEEALAQAVEAWQLQQGFSSANADGVIGPNTWARMKPLLPTQPGSPPSAASPTGGIPPEADALKFNQWHAQKIIDLINAGVLTTNARLKFDPKTQLEQIVLGDRVLDIQPQNKIIRILPLMYHIGEQARINNYKGIMIGSFIREASNGKCTGHCAGRSIDINFSGGSFSTPGSVQMVIRILHYLQTLPAQYRKNLGFGLPMQGDFFGNKQLTKFTKTSPANLVDRQLQQLIPALGIVFPDNDNHLHIQTS